LAMHHFHPLMPRRIVFSESVCKKFVVCSSPILILLKLQVN
jgi:hypothetical protein